MADYNEETARIDYESNEFVVNSLALLQQIRAEQEVGVSDDIDELLVQEVHLKRVLWDTSCRGYKDTNKKMWRGRKSLPKKVSTDLPIFI